MRRKWSLCFQQFELKGLVKQVEGSPNRACYVCIQNMNILTYEGGNKNQRCYKHSEFLLKRKSVCTYFLKNSFQGDLCTLQNRCMRSIKGVASILQCLSSSLCLVHALTMTLLILFYELKYKIFKKRLNSIMILFHVKN